MSEVKKLHHALHDVNVGLGVGCGFGIGWGFGGNLCVKYRDEEAQLSHQVHP